MGKKNSIESRDQIVHKLEDFKKGIVKELNIQKIILFGSRARGKTHRWSDVDLIIVSPKFKGIKFRKRFTRMYDYWTLDYPVDFLCYTPSEFQKLSRRPTIVSEAVKKGIEIK